MSVIKKPMVARAKAHDLKAKAGPLVWLVGSLFIASVIITGCGSKSDKSDKKDSQVAAQVNDKEITIHQVHNQLSRSGITGEAEAKEASKKILDSLIDQELLVQEAVRKKLDRDPSVMQTIEDAKRQILSQAYVERMVYSRTQPSPAEIKDFYDKHPELFAKRKAYKFHAFVIAKDKFNDSLKAGLDSAKTAGDVSSILKNKGIEFKDSEVQWLAEQAPMEILPAIAKMKVGDIVSMEQGGNLTLMLLENAVDNPVNEDQAKPVIEKFVVNSKNRESLENKLKQLRAGEQITYLGQFATATQPSNTPEPAKEQQPTNNPQTQTPSHIQKGLEGLK
jgi:EpsD family peptidyl-prolyl cis-trans isomerase